MWENDYKKLKEAIDASTRESLEIVAKRRSIITRGDGKSRRTDGIQTYMRFGTANLCDENLLV